MLDSRPRTPESERVHWDSFLTVSGRRGEGLRKKAFLRIRETLKRVRDTKKQPFILPTITLAAEEDSSTTDSDDKEHPDLLRDLDSD